jgi:CXXX repeat modification system protein
MLKEKVGAVTENEKKAILRLYERKSALKELYLTLTSPYLTGEERKTLYEMIVDDLEKAISQYEDWWREMPTKYNWKSIESGCWTINFETNEIYLEAQKKNAVEGGSCETGIKI